MSGANAISGITVVGALILLKDKGGYKNFPWTFPDISTGRYDDFFLKIRAEFKREKSLG